MSCLSNKTAQILRNRLRSQPRNKATITRKAFSGRQYINFKGENGGEPGIRTPGGLLTLAGFQDQSIQPLWQLTATLSCRKRGTYYQTKFQCQRFIHKD